MVRLRPRRRADVVQRAILMVAEGERNFLAG
jgi:hypothetical protein